jgi:hypothetical protein
MGGIHMNVNLRKTIVIAALTLVTPFVAHSQGFERIALGGKASVWSASDLDNFSLVLDGLGGTEVYEMDDNILFGIRPFVRLGLTRHLALELSHEFTFADSSIMVSSGTGIWKPFEETGFELHASICYGQLDWDDPGDFDSAWGWEAGAAYTFPLSPATNLIVGLAYRDLSFDFDPDALLTELSETRPDVLALSISGDKVDAAGFVADIGILVIF